MGQARKDTNDPCHTYDMQRAYVLSGGVSVLFAGHAAAENSPTGTSDCALGAVVQGPCASLYLQLFSSMS